MRRALKLIGEHNVANALGALEAGKLLGISEGKIVKTFSRFHGAWRRMEYRGVFQGARVYDDYAHHPTEIKATLKGLKNHFKNKYIICVIHPHRPKISLTYRIENVF
jgi:UDP-N-acetylmuramate--alanine ligase